VGADLEPSTVVHAYTIGLFPMGVGEAGGPPLGWWSPEERGVLLPGDLHVSRSLRRSRRGFTVTVDSAFAEVVAACADPGREGRWITPEVANAYGRLHELGWAHSVEVWAGEELAGGLYGMAVGGLFAGESMFHRRTDASKVALWALCDLWFADGDPRRVIDVQWRTAHLASLGVRAIERADYLRRLASAVRVPWLDWDPDTARRGFDPT
jgi:leucyl/phenylalanyl-tRNA--protein transferase